MVSLTLGSPYESPDPLLVVPSKQPCNIFFFLLDILWLEQGWTDPQVWAGVAAFQLHICHSSCQVLLNQLLASTLMSINSPAASWLGNYFVSMKRALMKLTLGKSDQLAYIGHCHIMLWKRWTVNCCTVTIVHLGVLLPAVSLLMYSSHADTLALINKSNMMAWADFR